MRFPSLCDPVPGSGAGGPEASYFPCLSLGLGHLSSASVLASPTLVLALIRGNAGDRDDLPLLQLFNMNFYAATQGPPSVWRGGRGRSGLPRQTCKYFSSECYQRDRLSQNTLLSQ